MEQHEQTAGQDQAESPADMPTDTHAQAEAEAAGRDRVRRLLLAPLAGMPRPRGVAASDYDDLANALSYMAPDALRGLAEFVLRLSSPGAAPSPALKCPPPGHILSWAYAMQLPPPHRSDYVGSVMRSVLGREAMDGGWHVQLYRHLRRYGPPPPTSGYVRGQLAEQATADARTLARIRERLEAGQQSPDDRRWLAAWHDDLRAAEAMVADGDARRTARAAMGSTATDRTKVQPQGDAA